MDELTLEQQQALALAQARRARAEAEGPKPGRAVQLFGDNVVTRASDTMDDATTGVGAGIPFSDEIMAGAAALPRAIARKVKAGDWQAPGFSDIGDAYNTEHNQLIARNREATQRSPIAHTVGSIAGGLTTMNPTAAAPTAATWGARAWQAGKQNAAYGLLYGAGEGSEDPNATAVDSMKDRAWNSGVGGVTGLVLGGTLQPAAESLVKGGQRAAAIMRGIRDPEKAASEQLGFSIAKDRQLGGRNELPDRGLNDREFNEGVREMTPLRNIERGGTHTRAAADSIATRSPEARAIMMPELAQRTRTQFSRIEDDLNSMVPGHTDEVIDSLNARARLENEPRYEAAHGNPNAEMMWDDELGRITGARFTQGAIKDTVGSATNAAVRRGERPIRSPFGIHKDTGELYLADPNVAPNLAFWDKVKRKMDDRIGTMKKQTANKDDIAEAVDIKNQLIAHLDTRVPEYSDARGGAAAFIKARSAPEAGEEIVTNRDLSPRDVFQMYAKMSPSERVMARIGAVNTIKKRLGNIDDNADLGKHLFNTPNQRANIGMILGDENMGKLGKRLSWEKAMQMSKEGVGKGSPTAQRIAQYGLGTVAGGAAAAGDGDISPWDAVTAGLTGGGTAFLAGKGMHHYDSRIAQALARKLMSADPKEFTIISKKLKDNPKLMAAVKAFMQPLSISGIQAPFWGNK
jgi:hypothetical protein